jgi:hypothetical protein
LSELLLLLLLVYRQILKKRRRAIPTFADVQGPKHTLGTIEKLRHSVNAKPILESLPHVGPQSIPEHQVNAVVPILGTGRLSEQISGRLSNVDKDGGIAVSDFIPESGGTELGSDAQSGSAQHAANSAGASGAVIHGHADVVAVAVWAGLYANAADALAGKGNGAAN